MNALGWVLLGITVALVIAGCALYATGLVGYAQLLWVLASGSAGGLAALVIESRLPPPEHDTEHWRKQPP